MRPIAEILTPELYAPLFPDQLVDPVDEHYLEKIEAIVKCKLPEDYAEFLRDFPQTGSISVREDRGFQDTLVHGISSWEGAPDSQYPIGVMYAQCLVNHSDLIDWIKASFSEKDPLFVFSTNDIGGGYIMRLNPEKMGQIYYSGSDIVPGEEPLIAVSFTDFINRIIEIP